MGTSVRLRVRGVRVGRGAWQTLLLLQQEWQRRELERESAVARLRDQLRDDQERIRRREEELERMERTLLSTGASGAAAAAAPDRHREAELER